MRSKLCLLLVLAILAFATGAVAQDYELQITSISDKARPGIAAQFLLEIKNHGYRTETFKVYSTEALWDVPAVVLTAQPYSSAEAYIKVYPTKYVTPGKYGVKLFIRRQVDEKVHEKTVYVTVLPPKPPEYLPSVRIDADMLDKIDPHEAMSIRLSLENLNPLNLTNLTLRISSELGIDVQQHVTLAPLEKKVIPLLFNIDPLQQPKTYSILFTLYREEEKIAELSKDVEVLVLKPPFKPTIEEKSFFLRKEWTVTFTSDSNVRNRQLAKVPTSFFEQLFTQSEPAAQIIKEDGKRYFAWSIELSPGESVTMKMVTSYRAIFYLLVIVLVIAVLFIVFQSPITITKSITNLITKEGGVSEATITLLVKNRSKEPIENITITDSVPAIVKLKKEFIEGTLKPEKVSRRTIKGTTITWKIEELTPGEERILSYALYSGLSIVGNFRLPRARAHWEKKGKARYAYSNSLILRGT